MDNSFVLYRNLSAEDITTLAAVATLSSNSDPSINPANLSDLYDYMENRLFQANITNDISALDEVASHLRKVKEGWDGIREEALEKGMV